MKVQLIKPLEKNKRYETCLSCSLFEVKDSVKFNSYFKSLKNIIYTSLNNKTFLRLYVDDSVLIKPSFQKWIMDNKPNLEVYKFEDKRFLLEDGIHHDGTFGTMARFLPFFDDKLDVDYIWISDVDTTPQIMNYKKINRMKRDNAKVSYTTRCYLRDWVPDDIDYPIIAETIIISKDVKISKYGFDKFLKDVYEDKYKDLFEKIRVQGKAKKHEQNNVKKFIYGFDELYLHKIVYKTFKKYIRSFEIDIGLFQLRWYHKNRELIEKLFYESLNKKLDYKKFEMLFKLYQEISMSPEANRSKGTQRCIKFFNENKDIAKKNQNFNVELIIKP